LSRLIGIISIGDVVKHHVAEVTLTELDGIEWILQVCGAGPPPSPGHARA
jgi:hypothetical protein